MSHQVRSEHSASPELPGTELSRIGQIALTVLDLGRATKFYRDTLGLPLLFEAPGMAFSDAGGVRLLLGPADRPELVPPGSILYYRVADIRRAFETLTGKGAEAEREPHAVHRAAGQELWLAFLHDSEGNVFALMSEVAVDE